PIRVCRFFQGHQQICCVRLIGYVDPHSNTVQVGHRVLKLLPDDSIPVYGYTIFRCDFLTDGVARQANQEQA
ncbi:MAG: hypothetical protein QF879_16400, partial [Candidatus Latescibacteria bacterium]|nr:hypothetical protein [Candidatus Latescibacterota bacterium]